MAVRLTLDGRETTADEGVTVFDAAKSAGVEIPNLCRFEGHENGVCRLCMVETDASGRASPACSTRVREGMAVRTDTPHLRELRRGVLSLLMDAHGIHDAEKSCRLESYASTYGVPRSRSAARTSALDDSHAAIAFDADLCILCRRCVIACQEEQVNEVLSLSNRGHGLRITFDLGVPLGESDCTSCGACVDVCPTGALIEKDWKPAERTVVTTCPYCGVGCTVEYGVAGGEIVWARGLEGAGVNRGKLCVKGKFAYQHARSEDRLLRPLIRRDGVPRGPLAGRRLEDVFREATWEEALDLIAAKIRETREAKGPMAVGGIASDRSTNEDVFAFQRFMRMAVGTDNVDQSATLCHAPSAAMLSWALGAGASTNPAHDLHNARTILLVGSNTERAHPVLGAYVKQAAKAGAHLVVVDPRRLEISRHAELTLALRPGTDVALFSAMARYILEKGWQDAAFIDSRTEGFDAWARALEPFTLEFASRVTGVPADAIARAAELYATQKPSAILWTLGVTEHENGSDNVSSLVNLALLTGNVGKPGSGLNPMRGQNNVQGGADMGATPGVLPGYQDYLNPEVRAKFERRWWGRLPKTAGVKSTEMMASARKGLLKFLYISGENSVRSHPDSQGVAEALRALDTLVVQDLFLTETAEYADVVLPAASSFEKSGTFTNTERRVQLVRPLFDPPGQAKADWWVYTELAKRLGAPLGYADPADIMEEIAELMPSYGGVTYDRLQSGGVQWPVRSRDDPGTEFLHTEAFARGKGRFRTLGWKPHDEAEAARFPYVLLTGRQREQYHTGTMTRRSPVVNAVTKGPRLEMNEDDMRREGLAEGEVVRIVSPRGAVEARAWSSPALAPGVLFTTFHYREMPVNILTPPTLDPITKTPAYKDTRVRLEKIR